MTKISGILAAVAVVVLASEPIAQESLPLIKHENEPLVDRLSNAADVSAARVVVGVMLDPGEMPQAQPQIVARIPKGWKDACARLLSSDAFYEGLAEYSPEPEATGGEAVLEFAINGGEWDELMQRDSGYLAVAVTEGECDAEPERHALVRLAPEADARPGGGGGAAEGSGNVLILVNGQGASNVAVVAGDTRRSCDPADNDGGVAFNWICPVSPESLSVGATEIRIIRRRHGTFSPPVTVFVVQGKA